MAKLEHQLKRVGGWFYRKLSWYGKLMLPVVVIAMYAYLIGWIFC